MTATNNSNSLVTERDIFGCRKESKIYNITMTRPLLKVNFGIRHIPPKEKKVTTHFYAQHN